MPKGQPPKEHQFKKGQSGNPRGRPKVPDISEALAMILNEEEGGEIALERVLKALRARAMKGDVAAIRELFDRAYGKAKQSIDHTSGGEKIAPPVEWINPEKDE